MSQARRQSANKKVYQPFGYGLVSPLYYPKIIIMSRYLFLYTTSLSDRRFPNVPFRNPAGVLCYSQNRLMGTAATSTRACSTIEGRMLPSAFLCMMKPKA